MKIRRFNEWVIERQFDEGARILFERAANPAQELEQFARMPDTPQKKGFIRNFWANHKNKFKGAAIGAAGIATLILAGIPLESLIPFFGLSAVRQGMNVAGRPQTQHAPEMQDAPWKLPEEPSGPIYVMAHRDLWKHEPSTNKWQKMNMQDGAQEIKQKIDAGEFIHVHRDRSSIYRSEVEMEKALEDAGVEKGEGWRFDTEPFDPTSFGFDFGGF